MDMSYDFTGVDRESGKPYGVLVKGLPESEWGRPWQSESEAGEYVETRLMLKDRFRTNPVMLSTDHYKIRTWCLLRAGVSMDQLEEWLASESDGKEIPPRVRDQIITLVQNRPESEPAVPGFVLFYDEFFLGRDKVDEATMEYWYDDDERDNDKEEKDGDVTHEALEELKRENITEEAGCALCGVDKAEVGSEFMWMPCSHSFHCLCLLGWLIQHCYCPTCNYRLPIETYESYTCVCFDCLIRRDFDCGEPGITPDTPDAPPHHPPPFLKFRF